MWIPNRRLRTALGLTTLAAAIVAVAPAGWARLAVWSGQAIVRQWYLVLLVVVAAGLLGSASLPRSGAQQRRRRLVTSRLALLPHVVLLLALAAAVALGAGTLLWYALGRPDVGKTATGGPEGWTPQSTFEAMKIVLALVAGLGGVVALTVAYRRQGLGEAAEQREDIKLFTERFTRAAELLGSDQAAVRLAAVYAVGALADDWRDGRQMCVDVLCAYLRMPCAPPEPGDSPDAADDRARPGTQEEWQVRHTVLRLIRDHLRLPVDHPHTWQGHDFDFTGAVFDGGDLSHIEVLPGTGLCFAAARFVGGTFSLGRSTVAATNIDFSGATVAGGVIDLAGIRLVDASIDFSNAWLPAGLVDLAGATLNETSVDFSGARLDGADVSLRRATLDDSYVSFGRTYMDAGRLDFVGATLTGGAINFIDARLDDGAVNFTTALFSRGSVDFTGAALAGTRIDFSRATLGSTIDLSGCVDRSAMPVFDVWPAKPPAGLRL